MVRFLGSLPEVHQVSFRRGRQRYLQADLRYAQGTKSYRRQDDHG